MLNQSSVENVHDVVGLLISSNFPLEVSGDVSDDLLVFDSVQQIELEQGSEGLLWRNILTSEKKTSWTESLSSPAVRKVRDSRKQLTRFPLFQNDSGFFMTRFIVEVLDRKVIKLQLYQPYSDLDQMRPQLQHRTSFHVPQILD